MDFSTKQVQEIQEIEKQVSPGESTEPQLISQSEEKDRSVIVNLLSALGISVVSTVAVIVLLSVPFATKKTITNQQVVTTGTLQINSSPNIVVQTEYVNPFSEASQYDNPFIASQNPFVNTTQ